MTAPPVELPEGVRVGHHTDRERWTGCTVILPPEGSVASCEVRGGGPGHARERSALAGVGDARRPRPSADRRQRVRPVGGGRCGALVGRAWGRIADAGRARATGPRRPSCTTSTSAGPSRPSRTRQTPTRPATPRRREFGPERGSVGAGTARVGKLLGPEGWTRGGVGAASVRLGDVLVAAVAVANPFGEVVGAERRGRGGRVAGRRLRPHQRPAGGGRGGPTATASRPRSSPSSPTPR